MMAFPFRASLRADRHPVILCLIVVAGLFVLKYRWHVGRPLWIGKNHRPTNADFTSRGTSRYPGHAADRLSFWAFMPEWQRGAIRTGGEAALYVAVWAWWTGALWAVLVTLSVVAGGFADLTWRAYRKLRHYKLRKTYTVPLHNTLTGVLNVAPETRPESWITIPLDFQKEGTAGVVLALPAGTNYSDGKLKQTITMASVAKLGLPDVDTSWQLVGPKPSLTICPAPQPPARVNFPDYITMINACQPGEIFIGLDCRGKSYIGSFLTDDPHWCFSVGSRRGKSSFLQSTAAQILHQDVNAMVTGIDPKRKSLLPLVGVPGFTLANDPKNVHEMWVRISEFREEMDKRTEASLNDPTLEFPMNVLMIDEVNQFSAMSKAYWREIKEKGDPSTPPVWADVQSVAWQGAHVHCHLIIVGQRIDDASVGGVGLRSSFGLVGLAAFRAKEWDLLIGTRPVPRSNRIRGRWIYDDGEDHRWIQNVYGNPEQIREHALVGRRNLTAAGDLPEPREGEPRRYTLTEASKQPWCDLSASTLRTRKHRANGTWPDGVDGRWTQAEILAAIMKESV